MIGFLSIDLAKNWMDGELAVGMESSIRLERIPHSKSEWRKILKQAKQLGIKELHVCMEATGSYWKKVAHYFHEKGARVYVVNPARIKAQRKTSGKRSKTDRIDASVIMSFIRANLRDLHQWEPPSKEVSHLQDLVRYREMLVQHRTALKNLSKSKHLPAVVAARVNAQIRRLDEEILQVEEHCAGTIASNEAMEKQAASADSVPGIGNVNAAILIAECRGFAEIKDPRQATAFAGLDVVEESSGEWIGKPRISKQGSALLRRAMVNAAASAIQRKGVFKDFYRKLLKRGLKKKQALTATARKLLETTVAVVLKGTEFDPDRYLTAR